jgi:hypothetical protein
MRVPHGSFRPYSQVGLQPPHTFAFQKQCLRRAGNAEFPVLWLLVLILR